jgi:ribosomal protein S24E
MKANIISRIKNPFFEREEIVIEINEKLTPSKEDVKDFLGGEKEKIIVNKIDANFGRYTFVADVHVYDSEESRQKVEVIPKKIRKKMAEEKKKAEEEAKKAAEAAKKAEEEAKAQENKAEEAQ